MNGDLLKNNGILRGLTGFGLAALAMWMFYNYASNHTQHNTGALMEVSGALISLERTMERQTEVLEELNILIKTKLE